MLKQVSVTGVQTEQSIPQIIFWRAALCDALRSVLIAERSVEVVTPVLCPYPEIAPLSQFVTTHPRSGVSACLRVAPTEFLKRLLVAGAESVFEFSTNFRSEIVDNTHLPEFTSLEVMVRGASVEDMQDLTERLCRVGLQAITNQSQSGTYAPPGSTRTYRIIEEWPRISLRKILYSSYGFSAADFFMQERVTSLYQRIVGDPPPFTSLHENVDAIVTSLAESFDSPVFIGEFPEYLGGPAKPCSDDARFKERTELFVGNMEIANMSSTLTDSVLLREWHERGLKIKEKLGIQPNVIDEPLLEAVAKGLAASAVLGLGIERLLMVAADLDDISHTRAFPFSQIFPDGGKTH